MHFLRADQSPSQTHCPLKGIPADLSHAGDTPHPLPTLNESCLAGLLIKL